MKQQQQQQTGVRGSRVAFEVASLDVPSNEPCLTRPASEEKPQFFLRRGWGQQRRFFFPERKQRSQEMTSVKTVANAFYCRRSDI